MQTLNHVVVAGRTAVRVPAARLHRVQAPVSEDELGLVQGRRPRRARHGGQS